MGDQQPIGRRELLSFIPGGLLALFAAPGARQFVRPRFLRWRCAPLSMGNIGAVGMQAPDADVSESARLLDELCKKTGCRIVYSSDGDVMVIKQFRDDLIGPPRVPDDPAETAVFLA